MHIPILHYNNIFGVVYLFARVIKYGISKRTFFRGFYTRSTPNDYFSVDNGELIAIYIITRIIEFRSDSADDEMLTVELLSTFKKRKRRITLVKNCTLFLKTDKLTTRTIAVLRKNILLMVLTK